MGRSVSFNKKELEKKRAQKKKEKAKRREERKANAGSGSLDDMIAYVDENGVITDTKPEPDRKKQEIDVNSIAVSTPKKTEEDDAPLLGRVEHFKDDKGYGFIKDTGSTEKYFFHITDAYPEITEGNMVNFELAKGNRGLNAVNIVPAVTPES